MREIERDRERLRRSVIIEKQSQELDTEKGRKDSKRNNWKRVRKEAEKKNDKGKETEKESKKKIEKGAENKNKIIERKRDK